MTDGCKSGRKCWPMVTPVDNGSWPHTDTLQTLGKDRSLLFSFLFAFEPETNIYIYIYIYIYMLEKTKWKDTKPEYVPAHEEK
jgi:hypothetical protein